MKPNKENIFTKLYQEHSSYMYAICLRYTKNADDAEDVMQDGFIKIYHALDTFKGDSNIKTWMRKIMVNTAINLYRIKQKIDFKTIDNDVSEVQNFNDNNAISKMSTDELLEVIQELPDGYRVVFNLYSIEGYKHREIAEMLDITEGTSKSQYAKARHFIQKQISEKLGINKESLHYNVE